MKMKELIHEIDQEREPDLFGFLKRIPEEEGLTMETVRRLIDDGAGSFSGTELMFLFLESLFQRVTGEKREW
jgi:hypothetical protein